MRSAGIVRLRKPLAISKSDESSTDVRSDWVGILLMAIAACSFGGRDSLGAWRAPRISARRVEWPGPALECFHEALRPARPFLCGAVRIARRCLSRIDISFARGKQFLGRIPALAVDAAQFKRVHLRRRFVQLALASRASAALSAAGSIVTNRVIPPMAWQCITVATRRWAWNETDSSCSSSVSTV